MEYFEFANYVGELTQYKYCAVIILISYFFGLIITFYFKLP